MPVPTATTFSSLYDELCDPGMAVQEELTYALDAAGQVYIFGRGPSGQYTGKVRRETFRGFTKVRPAACYAVDVGLSCDRVHQMTDCHVQCHTGDWCVRVACAASNHCSRGG